MSNMKKLVPELRFPEFKSDGEWQINNVEDHFEVASSKRVLEKDWKSKGIPFYRTRELVSLSKNEPFGSDIYISEDLYSELSAKYGVPVEGDFLISGVGTLGISYQVRNNDSFYFKDGNVIWFKLKGDLNSTYFKYCFQSEHIQKQIEAQNSKSTVGTYTIQNARKTEFWYPSTKDEQQKIASCLSSLDELIAAHNDKLQALKEHKKGLMQNLFPQEGETVPKLRFPEFEGDGDWEEKQLIDVVDKKVKWSFTGGPFGSNLKASDYASTGIRIIQLQNIGDGEFKDDYKIYTSIKKADELLSCNIYAGDILLSKMGDPVGRACIIPKYLTRCLMASDGIRLVVNEINYSKYFIYSLINSKLVREGIESKATGSTRKRIGLDELKQILLPTPKNVKEQQKIANCILTTDELISAQTDKIEQLKLHKKGLMQALFPNLNEN
jgi:type I restriction enzyme S subunit